jgi:dihydropteroate synthase
VNRLVSPKLGALRLHDHRVVRFPAVMGVLNVTPDSFSDGGRYLNPQAALEHALAMEAAGAAVIDVGGESTRPRGAISITAEVELERVAPVLRLLGCKLRVPISIDTRKAAVARVAIDLGAAIINDVSAMSFDPEMAPLAAASRSAVILMHMRGAPEDHMRYARYHDVVREVVAYLSRRAKMALEAGIHPARIVLDPGLGFSKLPVHSLKLLGGLSSLCALGYPVLIGASRKGFVRGFTSGSPVEIEVGTAIINVVAAHRGASILRVHDVASTVAALRIAGALTDAAESC